MADYNKVVADALNSIGEDLTKLALIKSPTSTAIKADDILIKVEAKRDAIKNDDSAKAIFQTMADGIRFMRNELAGI